MRSSFRPSLIAVLICLAAASSAAADDGWIKMFNGTDLAGWQGFTTHWSVQDGAITGTTTPDKALKHNTFLIWQGGQPANYTLRLKYKIVGGNSGVQYRSHVVDEAKFIVGGYQADIDSTPRYTGINYEERGRGILAERGEKIRIDGSGKKHLIGTFGDRGALQGKIKIEDWNDYRIEARGNRVSHFINGVQMSEVIDHQKDKAAVAGVIALQLHQGPPMVVQFKDIELKKHE